MGPTANAAETGPKAGTLNITFVAALVNDSYFVTIKCGALAAGKQLGVNVKWEGPTSNSVSAELSAFQAAGAGFPGFDFGEAIPAAPARLFPAYR